MLISSQTEAFNNTAVIKIKPSSLTLSWFLLDKALANTINVWLVFISVEIFIVASNQNFYSVYHSTVVNKHSSSFCHTASTDLPDPLLSPVFIIHDSKEVFQATSCIGTELLYISSSWSSYFCSSMWRGPQEHIAYEFILTSPAVSCMSGLSNLDSFCDGW